MESESAQPPLKVCPNCSVASRTDSATCPSCGASYARRGVSVPGRGVWIGIAIVVAAFALGYGVTKLVQGEDEGITFAEGKAVNPGVTRAELDERFDTSPELVRDQGEGRAKQTCVYYAISDREDTLWQFCFLDDKLVTADAVK